MVSNIMIFTTMMTQTVENLLKRIWNIHMAVYFVVPVVIPVRTVTDTL